MSFEAARSRIQKLEDRYARPKEPLVLILVNPDPSQPPGVWVVDASSREEEQALIQRTLATWHAERGGRNPEGDPAVLEARVAALEARLRRTIP